MKSKAGKKAQHTIAQKQTIKAGLAGLIAFPFPCPNCDQYINEGKLFCSEACKQEAKFVRYVRGCHRDGRDKQPDVQEAIQIKFAMILGGGYPDQERRLSEPIRKAIIKRDKGRCKKCGKPGTQIDHIRGSSNELRNLQLLCRACHNQKTTASFVTITPESNPEAWAKSETLYRRIESPNPLQPCDAEEWNVAWREILTKRRQIIKSTRTPSESTLRNPVLDYAEAKGFYDPEDVGEMSDGEQAEYLALIDGGGDEAWAADMFNLDMQDYRQWQKENNSKLPRKTSATSERVTKRSRVSSPSKRKRK